MTTLVFGKMFKRNKALNTKPVNAFILPSSNNDIPNTKHLLTEHDMKKIISLMAISVLQTPV